ncbi:CLUMA_CG008379, isoform A [Clunio marinus]|uniref:CLUMA_CG008379, isoform A n=1 Tax=Clunio marinus TaxID=568069 RepID=A0A1J1I3H5_9DIPT|nr:CLUMA_CG008379, isoform A [Clunio marinus]
MKTAFMNHQNKYYDNLHPNSVIFRLVPHHDLMIHSKTKKPCKPRELIKGSSYPVPIFTINYERKLKDPAMNLVWKKKDFAEEKRIFHHRIKDEKCLSGEISEGMIKYIEQMESDPAPNVGTEYDWHFAGGNLIDLTVHDKNYLAQPSMCSNFGVRLLSPKSHFMYTKNDFDSDDYPYEIISADSQFLAIRHKKSANFITKSLISKDQENLEINKRFEWINEISAATLQGNCFSAADVDNSLLQYDISRQTVNFHLKLPNNNSTENYFPLSLHTIDENILNPIKHRTELCTTGIAMTAGKNDSFIVLFQQNSLGDVFKSFLMTEEDEFSNETRLVKNFEHWDKALSMQKDPNKELTLDERFDNPELMFTDVYRVDEMKNILNNEDLEIDYENNFQMRRNESWRIDLEEAKEFKDILSQILLNEWDLDEVNVQQNPFSEALSTNIIHEEKAIDKVRRWLDDDVHLEGETMDTSELIETFQEDLNEEIKEEFNQEKNVPKTKKLSQRVKGF